MTMFIWTHMNFDKFSLKKVGHLDLQLNVIYSFPKLPWGAQHGAGSAEMMGKHSGV